MVSAMLVLVSLCFAFNAAQINAFKPDHHVLNQRFRAWREQLRQ
tara:strand:- start:136 stop:267 length:132 start_codon:yes stop_codon:yes gene_type:complete